VERTEKEEGMISFNHNPNIFFESLMELQKHVSLLRPSFTEATQLRFDQEKITLQSLTGRTFSS
jgi:hypothetical protein